MTINIPYNSATNKDDAYNAVRSAITPELLAKWQVKANIEYNEYNMTAKGSGFALNVDFLEDHCVVSLKLNLLLKPLQGKIAEGIEKQFKRVL
ncbi:MAG: hypothetical protein CME62_04620 [Halobacteriovoraceae bacterium]|nr:hypothetical protein [Halobacteriovoraceae bacterium]|tara:strand:+ start:873 stop:1151 length:279 start_codon:yes stop_codon:yes gene_type:complete